jgi:hypothetical protein
VAAFLVGCFFELFFAAALVGQFVHVGVLATLGPRLPYRFLQGGHQADDLAWLLLRLFHLRRLAVLPLGLDDLPDGLCVGVVELLAL